MQVAVGGHNLQRNGSVQWEGDDEKERKPVACAWLLLLLLHEPLSPRRKAVRALGVETGGQGAELENEREAEK